MAISSRLTDLGEYQNMLNLSWSNFERTQYTTSTGNYTPNSSLSRDLQLQQVLQKQQVRAVIGYGFIHPWLSVHLPVESTLACIISGKNCVQCCFGVCPYVRPHHSPIMVGLGTAIGALCPLEHTRCRAMYC
jgi:hypothetical protein